VSTVFLIPYADELRQQLAMKGNDIALPPCFTTEVSFTLPGLLQELCIIVTERMEHKMDASSELSFIYN
jgi:hypothetical protein